MKQLGKNVLFNTAGSLTFYICQAAMKLLVTALAGVQANGLLATAMTIANVGLSFASYGMRTFQVSDLEGKYTDRTYLRSRWLTVAAAWVACMAFAFANAYTARQRWVIFLYTGYRLVESWSDVWHGFLQKAERMDIVGISFGGGGICHQKRMEPDRGIQCLCCFRNLVFMPGAVPGIQKSSLF